MWIPSYSVSWDTGEVGSHCGCWRPDKEIKVRKGRKIKPLALEKFPKSLRTTSLFFQGT